MFTEHPDVVDGMIQIYKDWITDYDIDGFRIDTVKHVNLEFWQQFVPEILAHAAAEGKPDFFVFGEVFSGNSVLLSHYTSRADVPGRARLQVPGAGAQLCFRQAAHRISCAISLRTMTISPTLTAMPTRCRPSSATTTADALAGSWIVDNGVLPDAEKVARVRAGPCADVLCPRRARSSTMATSRALSATAATRTPARTCCPAQVPATTTTT